MKNALKKDNIDAYVGKRLRDRRTMRGLSQQALAEAVDITFQQIQKYEKGTNAMNASRLLEFARLMNVPVAYFFEELEQGRVGAAAGFSEERERFDHNHKNDNVSDRESLEMMKAYKRISQPLIRKRLADLVRAIADNKTILDSD